MARTITEAQGNGQAVEVEAVDDSTQSPTAEVAKTRTRKPRESASDKAIGDIKQLLKLKLQLQQEQEQVVSTKPAIEKLFTSASLTTEEVQNILKGLDLLGEYLSLKQQFQEAKDRASKAALALFEEAELPPDAAFELD